MIFFAAHARGCRDFFVFKHDENYTTFLIVQGDTDQFLPDTSSTKIDIASADALQLYIDVYPVEDGTRSAGCFSYCNDVICGGSEHEFLSDYTRWNVLRGTLELRRTEIDTTGFFDRYNVSLHIPEAVFVDENDDSRKISVTDIVFEDVNVGWLPG